MFRNIIHHYHHVDSAPEADGDAARDRNASRDRSGCGASQHAACHGNDRLKW